ncbi:MAG: hypothetical protein LBD59_01275 [Prevotellaceae bacterium]|jgi:hypothetical protein|nr:hypothetical protein [Prevotellaceae bacterium]
MTVIERIKKDSTKFGLSISTVLPLVLFLTVFLLKFHEYNYMDVWILPTKKLVPKILSLCIFPNGMIFYFYIVHNKLQTMRGMLIGTIIMATVAAMLFWIMG